MLPIVRIEPMTSDFKSNTLLSELRRVLDLESSLRVTFCHWIFFFRIKLLMPILALLLPANEVRERLCFHTCLSFCSQGSCVYPSMQLGRGNGEGECGGWVKRMWVVVKGMVNFWCDLLVWPSGVTF